MISFKPIHTLGDYLDGQFKLPKEPSGEIESINPGNLKDPLGRFSYCFSHVDQAVASAQQAFETWRKSSLKDRASCFTKLTSEIKAHEDELSILISRETGKPLWESKTEVHSLISKITITLDKSLKLIEDQKIPDVFPHVAGRIHFKPKGVMVVLGPFNFPAHLPHGHIVPALLTGNTVIFKPSEFTPAVGQKMAELFHRANFPKGVFNVIQGEKEIGKRLCQHPDIHGILFTGSYEVGLAIKSDVLHHYWKTVVLEMGGKNAAIVLEDAPFEKALLECLKGAYITSGQRCSATSRILVAETIAQKFIESFHALAKKIKIGYAFQDETEQPFMGPLIHESAQEKYLRFQGIAEREGAQTIMRGKKQESDFPGYYVTPSIFQLPKVKKESTYLQTEIFGPSVSIQVVRDLEEALSLANESHFGLALSIFSKKRSNFEKTLEDSYTGLVNWNHATVGASSRLPFGGQKKSGNQSPTALFAPYYCTYPVASLEDETEKMDFLPGLPHDLI
ncbi:MAG: aldehyde dehydrogenase family protein [Deltaproteobacteria bacterium]|nr:aldehyde dehydrogenase family protein [Deltaproteobacteria bacterium]